MYCDRSESDRVGDVHCVNCDNVSEVLLTLCIATEVNVTVLVMCTVLIVIMLVRCCNSTYVTLCVATEVNATELVMCTVSIIVIMSARCWFCM